MGTETITIRKHVLGVVPVKHNAISPATKQLFEDLIVGHGSLQYYLLQPIQSLPAL